MVISNHFPSSLYFVGRSIWQRTARNLRPAEYRDLWVVFTEPPGPERQFVEVEAEAEGYSVGESVGLRWRKRRDRLWKLESRENVRHGEMQIESSNSLVFNDTEPGEGAVDAVLEVLSKRYPNGTALVLLIELTETDIDEYYNSVTTKGVDVVEPLADRFGGRSRMFRIRDPYGFILTFIKRRPSP